MEEIVLTVFAGSIGYDPVVDRWYVNLMIDSEKGVSMPIGRLDITDQLEGEGLV